MSDIYISTDIEANGRTPGLSSMLSFASVALDVNKRIISTFSRNLNLLPGSGTDVEVMKFWEENPVQYDQTRIGTIDPLQAFNEYDQWLKKLDGTKIFVAYPAVIDFKWIDYYSVRFLGRSIFHFNNVVDIKCFVWGLKQAKREYSKYGKNQFPAEWFDPHLANTHIALDDAMNQGCMFINILRKARRLPPIERAVIL